VRLFLLDGWFGIVLRLLAELPQLHWVVQWGMVWLFVYGWLLPLAIIRIDQLRKQAYDEMSELPELLGSLVLHTMLVLAGIRKWGQVVSWLAKWLYSVCDLRYDSAEKLIFDGGRPRDGRHSIQATLWFQSSHNRSTNIHCSLEYCSKPSSPNTGTIMVDGLIH